MSLGILDAIAFDPLRPRRIRLGIQHGDYDDGRPTPHCDFFYLGSAPLWSL